jgi:hypothetical protein
VADVTLRNNRFNHVGEAVTDEHGWPIVRLVVVNNYFLAFTDALDLTGFTPVPGLPFRIDDSIVRWNRFVPGRYLDLTARQGPIATQLGAANRVDFSDNVLDGANRQGLKSRDDPGGFRAGFFWNMSNNLERLLISRNDIACAGDADGDGEALAFDNDRGADNGLPGAPAVSAAGSDWVTVDARLSNPDGRAVPYDSYYNGYWLQIVDGRGLGQSRHITRYTADALTGRTTLYVSPAWDVIPEAHRSRSSVTRLGWQIAVVDNDIDSRVPKCRKSNLTGPNSGSISIWGSTTDSVFDGNRQYDSGGIQFQLGFRMAFDTCPHCENSIASQQALDIRHNLLDGEYRWDSACSQSGIVGYYGATSRARVAPPILGSGITIAYNTIHHADGSGGGAIDFAAAWQKGPRPGTWAFALHPLIFGNVISDIEGPAAARACNFPAVPRLGIRLGDTANVKGAVLSRNQCRRVTTAIDDRGDGTKISCPTRGPSDCECPSEQQK